MKYCNNINTPPLLLLCLPLTALSLKAEWINLAKLKTVNPPRSGHVSFHVDDTLYTFGGYAEEVSQNGDMTRYPTNDLWKWEKEGWNKVKQGGAVPGARLASAAAVVDGRPTLFGGWDPQTPGTGGIILDSIHQYSPASQRWENDFPPIPGGPTSRHVALTLPSGDRAVIHNHRCDDHVLIYQNGDVTKQKTDGPAPPPRGLHAATMLGEKMVVFGGAAQSGTMSNDLFVLDTTTWTWRQIMVKGSQPSPRASPCFCTAGDCLLLFGGAESTPQGLNARADLWRLQLDDEEEGRWELVLDDDVGPPPRNAATLSEIGVPEGVDDGEEGEIFLLLQGGWSPFRTTWGDNCVLRVKVEE